MQFVTWLLTTPDANGRLVFLMQGIAVAFGIGAVCMSFIHDCGSKDGYVMFLTTLLGGSSLATVAKAYGKKVVGDITKTPPTDPSSPSSS